MQPILSPKKRVRAALLRRRSRVLGLLLALLLPSLLAACGKRGPPSPPGPANQVTYPKTYPTE
jgi:predicted small lipoprotein YifL